MSIANPPGIFAIALFIGICVSSANGLRCHKCDSINTPDCAINPTSELSSVECPAGETECAMAVLDDMVTYRGCKSAIQFPENCQTCLNATCTGDLCNNGIYPEDRLKCHKCERGDCVKVSGSPKPCVYYDKFDYCYVDVIDETDVIRGCVSDDDYDAGVYTKFCRSDGCNDAAAVSQFSCLSCDSDKDQGCKRAFTSDFMCKVNITNICTVDVLYGRSESCFIYHDGQRVVRGCARLEPQLMMQPEYISTCRSSECNNDCIMNPMCYVCDSNVDDSCMNNQAALVPQDCPTQTTSCFTCKNDDESIIRGCGNDTKLSKADCNFCWPVSGCNKGSIQKCYRCSSALDKNCAQWMNATAVETAVCNDECVAKVTSDGYIVRGCRTEALKCAPGDSLCNECSGDKCNGGIFPDDRQVCYQCDETDQECHSNQLGRLAGGCTYYNTANGCFQYSNKQGQVIRGCVSDLRYYGCKEQGSSACKVCYENECNFGAEEPNEVLECSYCDSFWDASCGWAQNNTAACLPKHEGTTAACFTYQFEDGRIIRGCMSADNACDPADVTCEICAKNGCNGENVVYQHCIQCSGVYGQGTCAEDAAGIEPTKCPGDVQSFDTRGCYTWLEADTVSRGCLNDFSAANMAKCWNSSYCSVCLTDACNHHTVFKSRSSNLKSYSIGLLAFVWTILWFK